ncbi:type VII secretion protein EccB [Streptomyces sp. NPDC057271]|uniref:type VII secretion protein EccB n=1 Tax=unclassified Streptomyces TaxID=2593676 RepID=UPI00363C229E
MHTRRDQVQAHLFTLSRVTGGLIRAEPDAAETPMRRFTIGAVAGTAIGLVSLGGMVAFGLISPGVTNSFKKQGTIVVEKETGTRYIFLDGALHPVLNQASVLLVSGKPVTQRKGGLFGRAAGIQTISSKSLKGVPKGSPIGIVGAPDNLPDAKALDRGSWTVCSATTRSQDGTEQKSVTAYLGGAGKGVTELDDQQSLLVTSDDGTSHLAWLDRRLKIPSSPVLTALGYAGAASFEVKASWLNSLPAGADLKGPDVPGRGTAGPPVGGAATRVGQVFRDPSGSFFLLLKDGLSPLSKTEAALVLADPQTALAYPNAQVLPTEVGTSAVAGAARSAREPTGTQHPAQPPTAVTNEGGATRVPCFRVTPGTAGESAKLRIAFRDSAPAKAAAQTAGLPRPAVPGSSQVADRVVVAPGGGVLVRQEAPAGEAEPRIYLITDLGVKYALTADVAGKLGYDAAGAVTIPSTVLDLVPTGPALDPEAARQPLAVNP